MLKGLVTLPNHCVQKTYFSSIFFPPVSTRANVGRPELIYIRYLLSGTYKVYKKYIVLRYICAIDTEKLVLLFNSNHLGSVYLQNLCDSLRVDTVFLHFALYVNASNMQQTLTYAS